MIYINNLSKSFGDHLVLNDISLSLPDRGLVLVCGDSGCGKTTLLNCISSLLTYNGQIIINGISLENLSESGRNEFRNKNIGTARLVRTFCTRSQVYSITDRRELHFVVGTHETNGRAS